MLRGRKWIKRVLEVDWIWSNRDLIDRSTPGVVNLPERLACVVGFEDVLMC